MFHNLTIGIIGVGGMGEAILKGILAQEVVEPSNIIISNPRQARRQYLQEEYGVRTTSKNKEVAEQANLVILAIKPQVFSEVAQHIAGSFEESDVVISILAGVQLKTLQEELKHQSVVRVMPNTPAQVGEGISVWMATQDVSEQDCQRAQQILACLGEELQVSDEKHLDMATAISGSGPAYVFLLLEAMIDAGVHLGFSRRVAETLVLKTIQGSVDYAIHSGKHVAELRNQVTSPAGTTADALYQMEKGGLRTVISKAVFAAYKRSLSLSEE